MAMPNKSITIGKFFLTIICRCTPFLLIAVVILSTCIPTATTLLAAQDSKQIQESIVPGATPQLEQDKFSKPHLPSFPDEPAAVSQHTSFPSIIIGSIVFLLMIITVLVYLLYRKEKQLPAIAQSDFQRQSDRGQKAVIYFNIVIILLVALLSWWTLASIKQRTKADWGKSMVTVRDSTQESVISWVRAHSIHLRYIAADAELVQLVEEQIQIYQDGKDLFSPQLTSLREFFTDLQTEYHHIGFFVIAPDSTNIGSLRDSNMGKPNLINKHRPDLFARAFSGETVFVPPIPSDVPLGKVKQIDDESTPPTMFFATPIKNKTGEVIAILTERFEPHGEFSHFFDLARIGDSGETYAFNRQGQLLSASHFHDKIRTSKMSNSYEQCILAITMTDPTSSPPSLTRMAASAIKGETGVDLTGYNDYHGVPVFGAWTWNDELDFGIVCELDVAEAMKSYYQARTILLVTMLLILFMISTFLWLTRRTAHRLGLALSRSHQELEELVTERTQELSQAKKRQDLIFATMSEALFVQNDQGIITFVNRAAVELLGYTEEELLGQNMHDALHHSNTDGTPISIESCKMQVLPGEIISVDDEVLWHKNGHALPVKYTVRRISTSDTSHGVVVVCHDIRDRLARNRELRERKAQLQSILDSAPIAVGISDNKKNHVFGNRRLFKQIRIKLGQKAETAFADPARQDELIRQLDRDGIVENAEVQLYAPDNSVIDTLATYIRSQYNGTPAIITWFYDISLQKRAERRIDQARKLAEDANRTKSEFLANMSHELRTPLNAIIGMSRLALQTKLNEKQHHFINSAYQSGEILLNLINDILDFSRIEAGKMELEARAFNSTDIFDYLSQMLSFQAKEKNIDLIFTQVEALPPTVIGDKLRLNQVLSNLLSNSIKFTNRGRIEVSVDIEKQLNNTLTLLYTVKDSGIGMTSEQQRLLFRPFIQADNSVARRYGGSGLGLVICKYLIEMMGGEIWLQSKLGDGTTFSFTVDLKIADENSVADSQEIERDQEEEIRHAIDQLKGVTVLLAEDNSFNRDLATELLTSNGLRIITAENGLEVLELLKLHNVAGILMDCQMPEMDGYTATREIRKIPEYKNIPILAMTANAMKEDRKRSLEAGMNGHICKPIDPHDLFTTMAQWFIKNNAKQ